MTTTGPVYLRWRADRPLPEEESFDTLDAALDAVVDRWTFLKHRAPQIPDARRVLVVSTAELVSIVEEEAAETSGEGRG